MKKALLKYRLQPLLIMKQRAKQKAEIALAKAFKALEDAKKKLKKLEEEKEEIIRKRKECRQDMHKKLLAGESQAREGHIRMNYLRKLEDDEKDKEKEIEDQKRHIEECEIRLKRAKRDYVDAVKEVRVMEKHKDLWRKKIQKEISREEEKEMDELGNVIHQLKGMQHHQNERSAAYE